jgi:hypothetical protein
LAKGRAVLQQAVRRLHSKQTIVLFQLESQENDARDHADIGEYRDRLAEIRLLQFFSPNLCIGTVNLRLLQAKSGHKLA